MQQSEDLFCSRSVQDGFPWKTTLCLLVAYLVFTSWNLWLQQIEKPDEPRYVCAGRELAERDTRAGTSDWVVPMFNGEPRLKKPILIYWVLAVAGKIGMYLGITHTTAFRAVPVLSGLVIVLVTFGLGRRLFGHRVGVIAALMLMTTYYFHNTMREIIIDPMLTALLLTGWYFFVIGMQRLARGGVRSCGLPFLGFYVCLGLACLAKGPPLVAIFAVIPICTYLFWERKRFIRPPEAWKRPRKRKALRRLVWASRVWYGAPLALFLGLFWFLVLWLVGEGDAVNLIIKQENLQRAAGRVDHNSGIRIYPFIFYIQNVPLHFLPWGLLLLPTWWWACRERSNMGSAARLLTCAIVIPWCIMGTVGSKRSVYMLPIYPFFALWVSLAWDRAFLCLSRNDGKDRYAGFGRLWACILGFVALLAPASAIVLATGGYWGLNNELPVRQVEYLIAGCFVIILIPIAILTIRSLQKRRRYLASVLVLSMVGLLCLLQESVIRPAQERNEDKEAFFRQVDELVGTRPLVWLGGSGNEGSWYLKKVIHEVMRWRGLEWKFFKSGRDAVLLVRGKELKRLTERFPGLDSSMRVLKQLSYGGKAYFLAVPNPEHPPPQELFKKPNRKAPPEEKVKWYAFFLPILFGALLTVLAVWPNRKSDLIESN